MKVSVVCPTYGRIPFLNRMVASFLSQTYKDKQLVIINDDPNVEICFDHPLVTIINLNKKILLPHKRNIGVVSSYCDLIMPFDDDDIFLPNRIDNHVKIHRDNPDIDYYLNEKFYIVYGNKFQLGQGGPPHASSFKKLAWFDIQGYSSPTNYGDDTQFIDRLDKKLILHDLENIDYVYNFGGINYHTSCTDDQTIEQKALEQLQQLDLVGKKFYIEPDFNQFNVFVKLHNKFVIDKQPIEIRHKALGVIDCKPIQKSNQWEQL